MFEDVWSKLIRLSTKWKHSRINYVPYFFDRDLNTDSLFQFIFYFEILELFMQKFHMKNK